MTELEQLSRSLQPREEILGKLRTVLVERLQLRRELDELDPDVPLFGSGFGFDSLDAVELVVCLESELGIKVTDPITLRRSFRTLNTLVDLVMSSGESRQGAA